MNENKWLLIGKIAILTLLVTLTVVGLTQAQRGGPEGEARLETATRVGGIIPIQGRLTDGDGNPLNGTYAITATLYDSYSGGTALCQDSDNVTVEDGLFNMNMDFCTSSEIDGRPLYLGIQVEDDAEMSGRKAIYPVPYAFSLRPGARISGTLSGDAILHIESWGANGRGLRAYAMDESGVNYGVVGASRSPNGYGGYFYNNGGGVALFAGESGIIKSTANISIAVSPIGMVASRDSAGNLEFISDGAYVEIRPLASGTQQVHIPVNLPGLLFGAQTELKAVRVCYRADQGTSYIDTTIVSQGTDAGTLDNIVNDTDNRASTSWECYTATPTNVESLTGSVYVQLTLHFAGTGSANDIRIGNIHLILGE